MQDLKYSLKCSLDVMKQAEGNQDNSYHIIYKDGTGIIFTEGAVSKEDIKKIKTTNIIYMDFQGEGCHLDSITSEYEEEGEDHEETIHNHLAKYNLEYYRIIEGKRKFDTIQYIEI